MKYQELENICRMEPATFKAAFVLLVGFGAGRISNVCIEDIHGDELPQEEKQSALCLAKKLAEVSSDTVFAAIQRGMPCVAGDGEEIPFATHFNDQDGICPCCGGEIEYEGDNDVDDDGTTVSWTCPECGASGKSGYTGVFDGHYDVEDADGNEIPGREENYGEADQ